MGSKPGLLNRHKVQVQDTAKKKAEVIAAASTVPNNTSSLEQVNLVDEAQEKGGNKQLICYGRINAKRSEKNVKIHVLQSIQDNIDAVTDGNDQGVYNTLLQLGLEKLAEDSIKRNTPVMINLADLQ